MEMKQGVAVKVRNTVNVSGGGKNGHVTTTHISIFQIDGKPIQLESSSPVIIDENDLVAVSGETKDGVFKALAYRNLSVGVSGDAGMVSWLLLGSIFPIAGLFIIAKFSGEVVGLVGMVFLFAGIYMLSIAQKINKASNELKAASFSESSVD